MKDSKSGSLPSGAGSLIPGFEVPQSPVRVKSCSDPVHKKGLYSANT